MSCPADWYSAAGMAACTRCGDGFVTADRISCVACAAGQFEDEATGFSCKSCPADWYSDEGKDACKYCGNGAAVTGPATCAACAAGSEAATSAVRPRGGLFYLPFDSDVKLDPAAAAPRYHALGWKSAGSPLVGSSAACAFCHATKPRHAAGRGMKPHEPGMGERNGGVVVRHRGSLERAAPQRGRI